MNIVGLTPSRRENFVSELPASLMRFLQVGHEIARLTSESKLLRSKIATGTAVAFERQIDDGELGSPAGFSFIWDSRVVNVKEDAVSKDFTITVTTMQTLPIIPAREPKP